MQLGRFLSVLSLPLGPFHRLVQSRHMHHENLVNHVCSRQNHDGDFDADPLFEILHNRYD
jgi:hypothetical protein